MWLGRDFLLGAQWDGAGTPQGQECPGWGARVEETPEPTSQTSLEPTSSLTSRAYFCINCQWVETCTLLREVSLFCQGVIKGLSKGRAFENISLPLPSRLVPESNASWPSLSLLLCLAWSCRSLIWDLPFPVLTPACYSHFHLESNGAKCSAFEIMPQVHPFLSWLVI